MKQLISRLFIYFLFLLPFIGKGPSPAFAVDRLLGIPSTLVNIEDLIGRGRSYSAGMDAVYFEKDGQVAVGMLRCEDGDWDDSGWSVKINLYDTAGHFIRTLGNGVNPYGTGTYTIFAGSVKVDPNPLAEGNRKIWFSVGGSGDDPSDPPWSGDWYSMVVDAGFTTVISGPDHEFFLESLQNPVDLQFSQWDVEWDPSGRPYFGGSLTDIWVDPHSIYYFKGTSLQKVVEVEAYSRCGGFAFDPDGNLYIGTHIWEPSTPQEVRVYAAARVQQAVDAGGFLSDPDYVIPIPAMNGHNMGAMDLESDAEGNIYLTAYGGWDPTYYYDLSALFVIEKTNPDRLKLVATGTTRQDDVDALTALSYIDGVLMVGHDYMWGNGGPSQVSLIGKHETCGNEMDGIPDVLDYLYDDYEAFNQGIDNPSLSLETDARHAVSAQPTLGQPVNNATGSTYLALNDIPSSSSLGLPFTRYYDSQSAKDGPMGAGWSHTYNRYLRMGDNSEMIFVVRPNGSEIGFDRQTLESWEAGNFSRMSYNETNQTYTFQADGSEREIYDTSGRLIRIEDPNGNQKLFAYENDRLKTITDPFGRTIEFLYNPDGRIESMTDPEGNQLLYGYTHGTLASVTFPGSAGSPVQYLYEDYNTQNPEDPDNNNLTGIISESGTRNLTIRYNQTDQVAAYSFGDDPAETLVSYRLGPQNNITRTTDSLGNIRETTRVRINGRSRVLSSTGPACASCGQLNVRYDYYSDSLRAKSKTNGRNITTLFESYDSNGNVNRVTEAHQTPVERTSLITWHPEMKVPLEIVEPGVIAGSKTTVYDYDNDGDANHNETPTADLRSILITGTTRDRNGNPVQRTQETRYDYNARGQVVSVDGPRSDVNDIVTYEYYPNDISQGKNRGMLYRIISPLNKITTFSQYNNLGQPEKAVSPNNQETLIQYDERGRINSITRDDAQAQYTYNADGTLQSTEGPEGESLILSWNQARRLTGIRDKQNNRIAYTLNTEGGIENETVLDPADVVRNSFNRTFNANNQVWQTTTKGGTREIDYDDNGNIENIVNEKILSTSYEYDALDRLNKVTQPAPGSGAGTPITTIGYNAQNRQTSLIDPEGRTVSWEYDDFGNVLKIDSPDMGTQEFRYDEANNIVSATDAQGMQSNYTYDAENRLTAIRYGSSSSFVDLAYDQGVNGLNRLTGITTNKYQSSLTWYKDGMPESITNQIDGHSHTISYTYDRSNRPVSITYPGGLVVSYTRNGIGQISQITAVFNSNNYTIADNLSYMPFGPVTGYQLGNGISVSIGYDTDYRVTSIKEGNVLDLSYANDPVGNILTITDNLQASKSQTFDYDNLNRLIDAQGIYGDISYGYDLTGNRANRSDAAGNAVYHYTTGTSRLIQITGSADQRFAYDANGRMLTISGKRAVYDSSGRLSLLLQGGQQVASYTYNAMGGRIKKSAQGSVVYFHYDLQGNLIAETDGNGNLVKAYIRLDGQPMAMIVADGGIYYYHNDHLGTPQKMTDGNGAVVWEANYLPFGRADVTIETVQNNLRFPGQYYDQETGLHYNYHRYYDPRTGRYLKADPIGLAGGINLYAYVLNNPVNLSDPWGLDVSIIIVRGTETNVTTPGTVSAFSTKPGVDGFNGYSIEPSSIYIETEAGRAKTKIKPGTYEAYVRVRSHDKSKNYDPPRIHLIGAEDIYGNPMPGAQLHWGNNIDKTTGCGLIGKTKAKDFVGNTRGAMWEIIDMIHQDGTYKIKVSIYD